MALPAKIQSNRYYLIPIAALVLLAFTWNRDLPGSILAIAGAVLVAAVFTAVHHAEVIALRVGEPFGSLILAVAVTIIEVGMIVVLIIESPDKNQDLPRDTVFAAIMITTNGIVGISLLIKTLQRKFATFNSFGTSGAVASVIALSTLCLVLPTVTTSSPGPTFTNIQLVFAAVISLAIYLTFVMVQTVRHRDYFLPPKREGEEEQREEEHVDPPTDQQALRSLFGLFISLVAVVGLAKVSSPLIQSAVDELGLPKMMVAISIALVVLLPESISAFKAAKFGRTQTSLNLAYGSALASIGLTIPTMAVISIFFDYQINLGLNTAEIVLMALTFVVSAFTVIFGKATLLQAVIHLSIFSSFILFAAMP